MNYTPKEIINFVEENDVKFIRLSFTDIYGNLKNIAIMPGELVKAFEYGIPFEAGYFSKKPSDLLLFPDISTLSLLPWRPKSGRVIRFFCDIRNTDNTAYKGDLRHELSDFIIKMRDMGYTADISTKCEFYLFDTDENGNPTKIPHDNAGYLDIAPLDKCENTRREICLTLEEMGFNPKTSRHSYGAGQNEIDFKRSNAVTAADNMVYYKTVVKNVAAQNGLFASFMPKPLDNQPGSGLHMGISVKKDGKHIFSSESSDLTEEGKSFIAGILKRLPEITCFLNPVANSYKRLKNRFASSVTGVPVLMRLPYAYGNYPTVEIRSSDGVCNPYIAFKLILAAGLKGIENREQLDTGIFDGNCISKSDILPESLSEAVEKAMHSDFVKENLSTEIYESIFEHFNGEIINNSSVSETDYFNKI